MKRILPRQREFAEAILLGYHPLEAAEIAGYSEPKKTARQFRENKDWKNVRDYVKAREGTEEWKANTTAKETFEWLINRLRLDFRGFFDEDGPIPIEKLSKAQASCISGFEFKSWENGEQAGESLKIKLTPINKAIDQLHRMFGLTKDTVQVDVHGEYQAAAEQLTVALASIRERQAEELRRQQEAEKAEKAED